QRQMYFDDLIYSIGGQVMHVNESKETCRFKSNETVEILKELSKRHRLYIICCLPISITFQYYPQTVNPINAVYQQSIEDVTMLSQSSFEQLGSFFFFFFYKFCLCYINISHSKLCRITHAKRLFFFFFLVLPRNVVNAFKKAGVLDCGLKSHVLFCFVLFFCCFDCNVLSVIIFGVMMLIHRGYYFVLLQKEKWPWFANCRLHCILTVLEEFFVCCLLLLLLIDHREGQRQRIAVCL
ncbi:hypothetical protein RFI_16500, partial [Reticulomyxa filosa]